MNSTFMHPALRGVAACEVEHLVGHVEADRSAGGAEPAGGDEDVSAGAGPEVEDDLARDAGRQLRSGPRSRASR